MAQAANLAFGARARRRAAPLLLATACGALAAQAEPGKPQTSAPQNPAVAENGAAANGRYTMTPVADGFLRLDTRTGQVSLCSVAGGEAQCRSSADERAALEAEIGRLAKENADLKAQAPKAGQNSAQQDNEDRRLDHALDRAERFMRRMLQLFRDASGKPPPTSL